MSELQPPFLSLVIPVRETACTLEKLLQHLLRFQMNGCEIVFVGESDLENCLPERADWKNLKERVPLIWVPSKLGRARQMNLGAEAASSSMLWFLHADSQLSQETFNEARNIACAQRDILFFFPLRFSKPSPQAMRITEFFVRLRSEILKIPFGDQGFLLPKSLFQALGCFSEETCYGEDHLLIWRAHQHRVPVIAAKTPLITSARKYIQHGWLQTTLRHQWLTWKQALPEFLRFAQALFYPSKSVSSITTGERGSDERKTRNS